MSNPLTELVALGQSPWIDFILRSHMREGKFSALINAGEIVGATSNPTIFEKAIGGSADYDDQIAGLVRQGVTDPKKIFDEVAITDIQMAADNLHSVYVRTEGRDGYISLEVSPDLANDTQGTIEQARYLWGRVQRPNVMIKVPATAEGLPAIEQLIAEGLNINITLIFANDIYEQVANAYLNALEKRVAAGQPVDKLASVASFFVSRVDTEVDKRLDDLLANTNDDARREQIDALHGKAAIANAKLAYEIYQRLFTSDRFAALKAKGAQTQRCLWASTSTKNPKYRDVLYVEGLIGPDTVDTMPPQTIDAFRDHGVVRLTLAQDVAGAHETLNQLEALGISMADVTLKLQIDGVKLFADSFDKLLEETGKKTAKLQSEVTSGSSGDGPSGGIAPIQGDVDQALQALDQSRAGERLWNKDFTFWKDDRDVGVKIVDRLGWLDIARVMETVLSDLEQFANEVRVAGFTHAVLLGMGGSSLCPEVFSQTFGKQEGFPELHVLDSTDPATILATERALDLPHTLFIVASKSGTTLETLSHFAYFFEKVKAVRGEREAGAQFVAITDPGTPLEALASQRAFRAVFRNPPDIGGRYSALSYFGMVPATVMGVDVSAIIDSALAMTADCGPMHQAAQNPGLWLGAVLGAAYKNGRNKVTIITSPPIKTAGLWFEQLIAESTGKEGRGLLPVAGEPLGSPEVYGNDRIFAYLRTDQGADSQQDAAIAALERAGQPVVRISLPNLYALGGEFYRWEVATAIAGHFLGINPFDEPNVQESKDNTKRILNGYEQTRRLEQPQALFTDGGIRVSADAQTANSASGATVLSQFYQQALKQQARAGDYIAIMAYIQPTPENDALLQQMRVHLRDATHLATTVGFGPRFLHSTGQEHKGGANTGIFIQIVADDREDVPIPGQPYTFGTLIHAQSLGDYQSLQNHQRRVIRLDLGNDIRSGLALLAE
jgi:transaldolase / glucose-6-phosphate isomerase